MQGAVSRGFSGVSFGEERFTDLDFATMGELTGFLGALARDSEGLGLHFLSWARLESFGTKIYGGSSGTTAPVQHEAELAVTRGSLNGKHLYLDP